MSDSSTLRSLAETKKNVRPSKMWLEACWICGAGHDAKARTSSQTVFSGTPFATTRRAVPAQLCRLQISPLSELSSSTHCRRVNSKRSFDAANFRRQMRRIFHRVRIVLHAKSAEAKHGAGCRGDKRRELAGGDLDGPALDVSELVAVRAVGSTEGDSTSVGLWSNGAPVTRPSCERVFSPNVSTPPSLDSTTVWKAPHACVAVAIKHRSQAANHSGHVDLE